MGWPNLVGRIIEDGSRADFKRCVLDYLMNNKVLTFRNSMIEAAQSWCSVDVPFVCVDEAVCDRELRHLIEVSQSLKTGRIPS